MALWSDVNYFVCAIGMWMSRGVAMNGALRNDKNKVLHDANKRSPLAPETK